MRHRENWRQIDAHWLSCRCEWTMSLLSLVTTAKPTPQLHSTPPTQLSSGTSTSCNNRSTLSAKPTSVSRVLKDASHGHRVRKCVALALAESLGPSAALGRFGLLQHDRSKSIRHHTPAAADRRICTFQRPWWL